MLVWGLQELSARRRYRAVALASLSLAALAACILLTRNEIGYWRDNESLFRHAIAVTENNDLAHFNLGGELASRGAFARSHPILRRGGPNQPQQK